MTYKILQRGNYRARACSPAAIFAVAFTTCSVFFSFGQLQAQEPVQYDVLPVLPELVPASGDDDETKQANKNKSRERKRLISVSKKVLSGTADFGGNKQTFTKYHTGYLFPFMTRTSKDALTKLPSLRRALLKSLASARSPDARDYLLEDIVLKEMPKIANNQGGNFHPAVRYNAMLIIGHLNEFEAVTVGANKRPPRPLDAALDIMTAAIADPNQIDAVKIAALVGILRYVKIEDQARFLTQNDDPIRKKIQDAVTNILKPRPASRSVEGHIWMQRRAIEIAATLGMVPNSNGTKVVLAALTSDEAHVSLRCTAAWAIGKIKIEDNDTFDKQGTGENLGLLAVDLCRREIQRVVEQKSYEENRAFMEKAAISRGGGSRGGGGAAGGASSGAGGASSGGFGGSSGGATGGASGGASGGVSGGATGGASGGGFSGGRGATRGTTKEISKVFRIDILRRRVKYQLQCVHDGLTGLIGKESLVAETTDEATNEETPVEETTRDATRLVEISEAVVKIMNEVDGGGLEDDFVDLEEEEPEPQDLDSLVKALIAKTNDLEAILGGAQDDPGADEGVDEGQVADATEG